MTHGDGDCCRLSHVLRAAETEFGRDNSWWHLARRAASHEPRSSVIAPFIARWEVMLNLEADGHAGPLICRGCRDLLAVRRDASHAGARASAQSAGLVTAGGAPGRAGHADRRHLTDTPSTPHRDGPR